MAEDFKHSEQTCLELLKMIDASSLAIEQLRQQQSDSSGCDRLAESFADCYTRKMLEDNEINIIKFLGRYLCEKEKLTGSKDYAIPDSIANFPLFAQWLKIIGVLSLMDSTHSDFLSLHVEEVLKPNGNDLIDKFCSSALLKSSASCAAIARTISKATENLCYYMNCLRSGTICDSEKLSWSHTEPSASHLRRQTSTSPPPIENGPRFSVARNSLATASSTHPNLVVVMTKNGSRLGDESSALITKLSVESSIISPLQSSISLRPPVAAVAVQENCNGNETRHKIQQRDSVLSTSNISDAEEQLALRTWKDIDGVVRRFSNSHKGNKRNGFWAKFMTWSARRHLHSETANHTPPERAPSLVRDRSNYVGPPRRLKSDPGDADKENNENENNVLSSPSTTSIGKSRSSPTPATITPPTPKCMIHVFTPHRVFVAKCDHCQRPMAFSCLFCALCKFRIHASCANDLPQIPLNSFKNSGIGSSKRSESIVDDSPSPQPFLVQSPSPPHPPGPPSPPPSPPSAERYRTNIPHAETISEPVLSVVGFESKSELAIAASSPVFPNSAGYFMDNQKENDEYFRDRKDSYGSVGSPTSGGMFVFPRRNTENEKTMQVTIPVTVLEEEGSPVSSPTSVNNYSATSYSAKSHIDSAGSSSGTGDLRNDMASPPVLLNGTGVSTPASYVDPKRQFSRRPTRMSTFSEWSVTLKEWLIPFSEIIREPQPIARGRYTTVYRGIWHGDVAVKMFHGLDEENGEGSRVPFFSSEQLVRTFKDEVSILPHTRHENLVLFLGASIDREQLVIVSTFCKGRTLDSLIYSGNNATPRSVGGSSGGAMHHNVTSPQGTLDQFSSLLTTADSILYTATQIAQAVAYLHNKGILHKDLRLRNIFIEANGRILLSDYGIFNATRLATNRHPDYLFVSRTWLFCLAPELARALKVSLSTFTLPDMGLPFSEFSDVFAFGCVWFELLHRTPPVDNTRDDCHVLLYGRGHCRMPEVKSPPVVMGLPMENCHELLAACWGDQPSERPRFADIIKLLELLSPLLANAAAAGIVGGGLPQHNTHKLSIGSSHRFAHHPVRSPSQPLRGGSSRGNRGLPFAVEPLTVDNNNHNGNKK